MCGHVEYEPTWRSGNCTSLLSNPEKMQGRAPTVWFCVDCAWWKQWVADARPTLLTKSQFHYRARWIIGWTTICHSTCQGPHGSLPQFEISWMVTMMILSNFQRPHSNSWLSRPFTVVTNTQQNTKCFSRSTILSGNRKPQCEAKNIDVLIWLKIKLLSSQGRKKLRNRFPEIRQIKSM